MGKAAQTGFNATHHDRRIRKGFATLLGIDSHCAIRTLATDIISGIGIVMAQSAISGVAIDHRIHIAGSHTKVKIWLAQHFKALRIAPIRLRENTYSITLSFKNSTNNRHTETGMIHIGIPCHQNNITAVPAELIHLFSGHRQKRCRQ